MFQCFPSHSGLYKCIGIVGAEGRPLRDIALCFLHLLSPHVSAHFGRYADMYCMLHEITAQGEGQHEEEDQRPRTNLAPIIEFQPTSYVSCNYIIPTIHVSVVS